MFVFHFSGSALVQLEGATSLDCDLAANVG
jgi:hypothetical protein